MKRGIEIRKISLALAMASACAPSVAWSQLSIAMHAGADTAEAMAAGKAPEKNGSVVNPAQAAWTHILCTREGRSWVIPAASPLHADGTPSSAKISGKPGTQGVAKTHWQEGSKDHAMMEGWIGIRGDEFIQVEDLPTEYQEEFSVRIFGNTNFAMLYTINGVTQSIVTSGSFGGEFIEGFNQTTFTGLKGASFRITGNPIRTGKSTTHSTIAGIQIFKGLPPAFPVRIHGTESPNVHSPGSAIEVTVDFGSPVKLSAEGGASIELDFAGMRVRAIHRGPLEGDSLVFAAKAPAVTTMSGKVVADSLRLEAGVTLKDRARNDAALAHRAFSLPNDQISVEGLAVYPHVPGLDPSPHYRFRVREIGSDQWLSPFAFMTKCIDRTNEHAQAYYAGSLGGWSHTYCNFELANNVPIEVEISRLNPVTGQPVEIRTAVPHPRRKVSSWRVENGKAYVTLDKPALFAVDIDGQMDENPLPRNPPHFHSFLNENAIHTVSVFANPFILDKPDLNDPSVFAVEPGTIPPQEGDWKTLYFKPGVHQVWDGTWNEKSVFYLQNDKNYYIPGDALVHGTMRGVVDRITLRIFGHGTLTQERIPHANHQQPKLENRGLSSAMRIGGAIGSRVEGITISDSPDHTLWLNGSFNPDPATWNYIRWVKAFTWRSNGDGITVDDNDFLEDSFIRTQDDGTYLKGRGVRRIVYWTDSNGTALKINMISRKNPDNHLQQKFYVEDIDILYGRSHWPVSPTHQVFGGRDNFSPLSGAANQPNQGSHIVFRNIQFHDPVPLRRLFGYAVAGRREKHMVGIRFENIRSVAPSLHGYRPALEGMAHGKLRDFAFDNIVDGGSQLTRKDQFNVNEHVENLMFKNTEPEQMVFQNKSGHGKWYMREDWSTQVEPADHDHVKHTAYAGALIVDCPAWAGTLEVAHADKAVLQVGYSARLFVSDTLTVGSRNGGHGQVRLIDGELILRKAEDKALSLVAGDIHIGNNGTLLWAGDRTETMKKLFSDGRIQIGEGRHDIPRRAAYDRLWQAIHDSGTPLRVAVPVLLGMREDGTALYADYDNINPGFTTFWVRAAARRM